MKKKSPSTRQQLLFPDTDAPPAPVVREPGPETEAKIVLQSEPIRSPTSVTRTELTADDLVIVVDSHSLIYQVFHALPSMTGPDGVEVGAIHGFLRDLADLREKWQPDFLICAFDASEITFRNELYSQYKAHRDPMPEALRAQMPLIHQAVETLDIGRLSMPGFEADDILATIAAAVEKVGARCLLVTSDKDCRQLLSDRVQMLNIRKAELYGIEQLRATWGIAPGQVVDFQAMVGDASDNVPGVPQIGPKAAQQLLEEFGSLASILENIDRVPGAKRQETLRTNRDSALLSQQLVRLKDDVPIDWSWTRWGNPNPDPQRVEAMFRELGFRRLAERFIRATTATPSTPLEADGDSIDRSKYLCAIPNPSTTDAPVQADDSAMIVSQESIALPERIALDQLRQVVIEHYQRTPEADRWLAIDSETTSLSARDAEPVGYSISWSLGQAAYISRPRSAAITLGKSRRREKILERTSGRSDDSKDRTEHQVRFDRASRARNGGSQYCDGHHGRRLSLGARRTESQLG